MVSWDPWYVIGCIKWWLGNIQSVDIYKVWKYTQRGKYADLIEAPPRPGPHCGESYSHGHHHWTYTICTIHHVQTTIHKIYHIYIPPLWWVFYPPMLNCCRQPQYPANIWFIKDYNNKCSSFHHSSLLYINNTVCTFYVHHAVYMDVRNNGTWLLSYPDANLQIPKQKIKGTANNRADPRAGQSRKINGGTSWFVSSSPGWSWNTKCPSPCSSLPTKSTTFVQIGKKTLRGPRVGQKLDATSRYFLLVAHSI